VRQTRTGNEIGSAGENPPVARRTANPVLGLQRQIGNRATREVLARAPATKDNGTVHVGKLPAIKILGGNAGDWAAGKDPYTVEITSKRGRHSAGLERLSREKGKIPMLKVTTPIVDQSGQHLNFGRVELEFSNPRIADYTVDGNIETWRAVDFNKAHRTTISHMTGI
jgi:hypothetical protein